MALIALLFGQGLILHADEGWTDLFNGKDLSGWEIVVAEGSTVDGSEIFQVEDGMIHVYPLAEDGSSQPFAGIYTAERYSDYHLVVEYKWGEKKFQPRDHSVRDAGIIFHVVGEPHIWPTGVECQIQEGDTGDIWIIGQTRVSSYVHPIAFNYDAKGDLETRGVDCGPQRFARGYSWEVAGWNTVEVIVQGNHATYKVNDHTVNEAIHIRYRDNPDSEWEWQDLVSGPIFLQAEGAEVYYRNIRIKEISQP